MASELRVNTLKDASGNNSIATSFVAGGSAKAWVNADHTSNAIASSFNYSSFTDIDTGDSTLAFTSNMSGAQSSYSLNGIATNNSASSNTWSRFYTITAGGYSVRRGYATTTEHDWSICMDQVHGDLA
jgi:hypothetical protein